MAIKERYKNNVGYLYKMSTHYNAATPTWDEEGIPFHFNKVDRNKKIFNPMSGVYMTSTNETWQSDTQIDFADGDKVTTVPIPRNDAEFQDFSLISSLNQQPINEKGNRYRTKERLTSKFVCEG